VASCLFREQEAPHLVGKHRARRRIAWRQPVLVDQHRLVRKPLLPRFATNVFVNALPEFARPRWPVQAFRFLLRFLAKDSAGHMSKRAVVEIRPGTAALVFAVVEGPDLRRPG